MVMKTDWIHAHTTTHMHTQTHCFKKDQQSPHILAVIMRIVDENSSLGIDKTFSKDSNWSWCCTEHEASLICMHVSTKFHKVLMRPGQKNHKCLRRYQFVYVCYFAVFPTN